MGKLRFRDLAFPKSHNKYARKLKSSANSDPRYVIPVTTFISHKTKMRIWNM